MSCHVMALRLGGLDYIVPFMISVLMAKAVGDSLNEGLAHRVLDFLMGIPA